MENTVNTKKYQVIVTYDNNDYVQTYFNAYGMDEVVSHYRGHEIEYYDGSSSGAAYALDIKDMGTNDRYVYYYDTDKYEKVY